MLPPKLPASAPYRDRQNESDQRRYSKVVANRSMRHLQAVIPAERSQLHNPSKDLVQYQSKRFPPNEYTYRAENKKPADPDLHYLTKRSQAPKRQRIEEKREVRKRLYAAQNPKMLNYAKLRRLDQLEFEREQKFLDSLPKPKDLEKFKKAHDARILMAPMMVNAAATTRFAGRKPNFNANRTLPLASIDFFIPGGPLSAVHPIALPTNYPVQPAERFVHDLVNDLVSRETREIDFAGEVLDPDKVGKIDFLDKDIRSFIEKNHSAYLMKSEPVHPDVPKVGDLGVNLAYHYEDYLQGDTGEGFEVTSTTYRPRGNYEEPIVNRRDFPAHIDIQRLVHGVPREDHRQIVREFGSGLSPDFMQIGDAGFRQQWWENTTPDERYQDHVGIFNVPTEFYPAYSDDMRYFSA